MKRTITTVLAALTGTAIYAQSITSLSLGTNNVFTWASNNGTFFWNSNGPGYEIPINSDNRIISFMNVMAVGEDVNNQLKGAITGYPLGDFFGGRLLWITTIRITSTGGRTIRSIG